MKMKKLWFWLCVIVVFIFSLCSCEARPLSNHAGLRIWLLEIKERTPPMLVRLSPAGPDPRHH
ncbi:hypothetical protein Lalb_Chr18g0059211 [Lupinus albus]|uniref:Uncharacterized protein n=1 Tax=Lupinus albus TaxID=3870 RepID=A0A6A4P5L7_LUPAL|nr:hypothetical protein Lalb_Chr18g0059211 [Lupinus albus]